MNYDKLRVPRFTLLSLLLLMTLVAVVLGWIVDRSRSPEIWYLHIYSTRYDIYSSATTKDYKPKHTNQCVATIAISPGVKFHANLPDHYEPELEICGLVTKQGKAFGGAFRISVADVGTAFNYDHVSTTPLDVLIPFGVPGNGPEEFFFAIAHESDPYALDWKRLKDAAK